MKQIPQVQDILAKKNLPYVDINGNPINRMKHNLLVINNYFNGIAKSVMIIMAAILSIFISFLLVDQGTRMYKESFIKSIPFSIILFTTTLLLLRYFFRRGFLLTLSDVFKNVSNNDYEIRLRYQSFWSKSIKGVIEENIYIDGSHVIKEKSKQISFIIDLSNNIDKPKSIVKTICELAETAHSSFSKEPFNKIQNEYLDNFLNNILETEEEKKNRINREIQLNLYELQRNENKSEILVLPGLFFMMFIVFLLHHVSKNGLYLPGPNMTILLSGLLFMMPLSWFFSYKMQKSTTKRCLKTLFLQLAEHPYEIRLTYEDFFTNQLKIVVEENEYINGGHVIKNKSRHFTAYLDDSKNHESLVKAITELVQKAEKTFTK